LSFPFLLFILGIVLAVQTTFVDYFTVFETKPDLVMLFVVFSGFLLGPKEGAFLGFAGGIIVDLYMGSYIGLNALTLMTAGVLAGICGERLYKESSLIAAGVTFLSATVSWLVNYLLLRYLGVRIPFVYSVTQIILPAAIYTSILVPFFYLRIVRSLIVKTQEP